MHLSTRLSGALVGFMIVAGSLGVGCAAEDDEVGSSADEVRTAREGGTCGNGVFGTPKIDCRAGLECVYPATGTAPTGPAGSSSARTGTCERRAQEGDTCGNGVFGTPNVACGSGLECIYPASGTAPTGPAGSSSARAGTCERRAKEGETCANGVFGTPNIACGSGLECVYPASGTAPTGPAGSSSARTGACERRAQVGETCANGVFGTPKIACASNLVCVYPASGTAPAGPTGSSSARTGTCELPPEP